MAKQSEKISVLIPMYNVEKYDAEVEAIMQRGETYANEVANAKLHQVQKAVGLRK